MSPKKVSRDKIINLLLTSHNEPEKLPLKEVNKGDVPAKDQKLNYLQTYLASMKLGTKIFQHFLGNSNLSKVLEGENSQSLPLGVSR